MTRTPAFLALFSRYFSSSLSACLTSTLFTSCSSVTPLSGRASLVMMKSSGEMNHAENSGVRFVFLLRLSVSVSKTIPSGFVHNSISIFSFWSFTRIRGFRGEQIVGSKSVVRSSLRNRLNSVLVLMATARSKSTVVRILP